MSYRSLHIGLLVLLLALDVAMINISGISAFWLRCKTALFEEADLRLHDLRLEDVPIYGAARTGRYRIGEGPWRSLTAPVQAPLRTAPLLRVDLGVECRIDEVRWTVFGREAEPAISVVGEDGELFRVRKAYLAEEHLLTVTDFPDRVESFQIAFVGVDQADVGDFSIRGLNLEVPSLLRAPQTEVPEQPYWYLMYVWNVAALFGLVFFGAYRITRSLKILHDLALAVRAVVASTVAVIVVLFLYRGYQEATYVGFEYSRIVVILCALFATILLTCNRVMVDAIHAAFLKRGVGIRKVVVVGAGAVGQGIVHRLRKHYWLAYKPVAFVDDNSAVHGSSIEGLPVLGGIDALPSIAREAGTNEVIVALPNSSHKSIRDIVGRCRTENLKFHILPDLFQVVSSDVRVGAIDGAPVLDLDDVYLGRWDRILKRGLDVGAVVLGGILLLPVWALIAIVVKVTSQGPVLFTQQRVGEHGKTFPCYKFRTMRVVSVEEEKKERQSAYANLIGRGDDGVGKVLNSSRVTSVGKFLRKYRLDELPQILNVLRGEMSLVGPRPPIPYEIEHYNSRHMERLKGKPGVTGLWQVSGGPALSFEEMVRLDIYYLQNWSLQLDFKILAKTVAVILSGKGS